MHTRSSTFEFCFRNKKEIGETGNFSSKIRAHSGEFRELRAYIPGESVARVDFRKSNFETGALIVREYTQEREFGLQICLYIDPSWRFGTQHFSKIDLVSESLAYLIESLWVHEMGGQIWIVSQSGVEHFPIPESV